jgi:hypothetical protein
MPLWRIRITLADDPHSRTVLDQALAGQQVTGLNFTPRTARPDLIAGDVLLELPNDEDLDPVLTALHQISPQVFVSRVADGVPGTPALTGTAGQPG